MVANVPCPRDNALGVRPFSTIAAQALTIYLFIYLFIYYLFIIYLLFIDYLLLIY